MVTARRLEEASCRCHSPEMRKRSVTIGGHRTSISLEDAFWAELAQIAEGRGLSLNGLISEIDQARRAPGNLSSALRLHVLDTLRKHRRQN
jgi:predicted DNA-binding ribbon-helix-helix protein